MLKYCQRMDWEEKSSLEPCKGTSGKWAITSWRWSGTICRSRGKGEGTRLPVPGKRCGRCRHRSPHLRLPQNCPGSRSTFAPAPLQYSKRFFLALYWISRNKLHWQPSYMTLKSYYSYWYIIDFTKNNFCSSDFRKTNIPCRQWAQKRKHRISIFGKAKFWCWVREGYVSLW